MYKNPRKKLLLLSVLSLGLAASPGVMAKPEQERGFERSVRHDDRGSNHERRDDRHDSRDQSNHRQDDRHDGRHDNRNDVRHNDRHNDRHDGRHDGRHAARHDDRHDNRRDDRHDRRWHNEREHRWNGPRYRVTSYHAPRGYVRHKWHRGDRMPASYRGHRHVVHDYHSYQLYSPPRGHHWVRVDQDIVLTAVATGVVAAVVYGIFQ